MTAQAGSRPLIALGRPKRPPEETFVRLPSGARVDVRRLWTRLKDTVVGEVRFDRGSRALYAQDASNYRHVPLGVVLPMGDADVMATLAACREQGVPIVGRTGGTSLAGQTCNEAIVVDFSKYMRRIVGVDPGARTARVQPGVLCDELDAAVKEHRLVWGPKPATHAHCGFGGMLSNNCGGMNAQYAGIAVHNVEALDVTLYDGTRMQLGWMDESELAAGIERRDAAGLVLAKIRDLRDRYASRIRTGYPRFDRRVSGYNLDQLLPGPDGRFNLARTIVGTEGTCVTILEATVRLVDLRPERVVVILGYPSIFDAADAIPSVLAAEPDPLGLEGMDQRLYDHIQKKGASSSKYLSLLPEGHGWLILQIGSDSKEESVERARRLVDELWGEVQGTRIVERDEDQHHFWAMREDSLGATAFVPGEPDTWEGWEDSAVPHERLGAYLRELDALYHQYGYTSALYGHFGQGLVHCRVDFDLTSQHGVDHFHHFLRDAARLVHSHGGSLSGEHGDGQSKAEMLEIIFGPELVRAFGEFKAIWDPGEHMNPGKIVHPLRPDDGLRLGAGYDTNEPHTHFKYPDDQGSLSRAALRCVGIGKCRNLENEDGSVMCPSFMVTEEEQHSTRGRAHLLWEMLRGDGPVSNGATHGQGAEAVKESLDLCLACKGCKRDCPVNVDMATYKAEFLAEYYRHRPRPRHAYAFGLIDRWARVGSLAPGLVNLVGETPGLERVAKLAAGMHPARTIPAFAPQTFRAWFAARSKKKVSNERVLLWVDTFTDHFHPETGRSAVKVLEHLGLEVVIPDRPVCCGRPLYDFGMLDLAERYLNDVLECVRPAVTAGLPVVVLEPSCASVFRDELRELMPARNEAKNLREQTFTLAELLGRPEHRARLPVLRRKAIVQTHCHHHAVMHFEADKQLMEALRLDYEVLDSGCCGMAGSFGFEEDKYAVSQACGERVLLPRVRSASPETMIIADGFSCRTQIEQATDRHALHLADVIALAIDTGPDGPKAGPYVESAAIEPARKARRASKQRTLAATALVAALAGAALLLGWSATRS